MRSDGLPLDRITWLLTILILPWTLKFLWAPVMDVLRRPGFGFRHWALIAQSLMVLSLLPLLQLDLRCQFPQVAGFLLLHALAASTQDVAIDALCIESSQPDERPSLNGWMQAGMLGGRAVMGGGSLLLEQSLGYDGVLIVLMMIILFSGLLLLISPETDDRPTADLIPPNGRSIMANLTRRLLEMKHSFGATAVWLAMGFALIGPAAFKSLESVLGPYLIDRGLDEWRIGMFTSFFMLGAMVLGSLSVGWLSGRYDSKTLLVAGLIGNLLIIAAVATLDFLGGRSGQPGGLQNTVILAILTCAGGSIGFLTVSMYSWLMNCTNPKFAATQFTLFMACTNACEAWSTTAFGMIQVRTSYAAAMIAMILLSSTGLLILIAHRKS